MCVCVCLYARVCVYMCVTVEEGGRVGIVAVYLLIPRPSYLNSCHSWPSPPSCSDSHLSLKALSLSPAPVCRNLLRTLTLIRRMSPSGSERSRRGTAGRPAAASLRCTPGNSRWTRRRFAQAGSYCPQAGCKLPTLLSASPYCCHPDRGNKMLPLWRCPLETNRVVNTGQQVVRPYWFWSLGSMWPAVLTGKAHPGSRWAANRREEPRLFWRVKMVLPSQCFSSLNIRTLQLCGCTFRGCWNNSHPWRKMILPLRNPSGSYRALCYSDMTFLHLATQ